MLFNSMPSDHLVNILLKDYSKAIILLPGSYTCIEPQLQPLYRTLCVAFSFSTFLLLSLTDTVPHISVCKHNVASVWDWPCSLCQPPLCDGLICYFPCGLAHCGPCVANTRWYCAASYSMLMLFVALEALGGLELAACVRTTSVIPECGALVYFVDAHLQRFLQLASPTSAAVIEVQQSGFHLGMYDHHCSPCHLPCRHVSTDGIHIAEQEG